MHLLVGFVLENPMEMSQARYFLALAEELNFTKAAARCNVSQPSLTRAIKLLETELGGPLIRRERGHTDLSELGKLMLPYLREVCIQAHEAKKHAKDFCKTSVKRLRLGVMCTIAPEPLLSLVEAINKDHPDVDLEIVDANAARLEEQLLGGQLDVCLYCRPDTHDDRIHYLKIFDERMVIVLSPDDNLSIRPALRLADLNDQRYLHRTNCEFSGSNIFDSCDAKWHAVYHSDRDDWILAMVAAGLGFGFLPESSAMHSGVLVRPLVEPRNLARGLYRDRPRPPILQRGRSLGAGGGTKRLA